jgi:hypothetical protein
LFFGADGAARRAAPAMAIPNDLAGVNDRCSDYRVAQVDARDPVGQ